MLNMHSFSVLAEYFSHKQVNPCLSLKIAKPPLHTYVRDRQTLLYRRTRDRRQVVSQVYEETTSNYNVSQESGVELERVVGGGW